MSSRERMVKIIPLISVLLLVFVLQGYECVTPGKCPDLMFVDNRQELVHAPLKTVMGDNKTGMVLYETISYNDNNTYFAYIAPVCKIGNIYRFNCLAIKNFTSRTDVQTKNSFYCPDREIRINAECRLPTLKIINGSLYCELEPPGSTPSTPRIAKISMSTGQILKTTELGDAKTTSLFLKTRDSSWKPYASGMFSDVTVHTFVDGTEFWGLYESSKNSANSIVVRINLETLAIMEKITIKRIYKTSKVLMICGKLYEMKASNTDTNLKITNAIDIYNPNNTFSYSVNLVSNLPVVNKHVWIDYNPKLNELFISVPNGNTLVYRVALCDFNQEDTRSIDLTRINSTFFWSLSATEPTHLVDLSDSMTSYFTIENITELEYVSNLLLICPLRACSLDLKSQTSQYCRIKSIISTLKAYSDYKHMTPQKKLLQIHFSMEKILNQQNYVSMTNNLNVLKTFMSSGFTNLKSEVDSLRQDIGSYFTELAEYDRQTARSDLNLVYRYIGEFKTKATDLSSVVNSKISTMVDGALAAASADLVAKVKKVVLATAALCNPIESIADTSGVLSDLAEAMDRVSKATSELERLTKTMSYLPKMRELQDNFRSQLEINSKTYKTVKELVQEVYVNGSLTDEQMLSVSGRFLKEYDSYAPGYFPSTINDIQEMMSAIIEELCDVLFGGDTAPSVAIQMVFAVKGTCFDTKIDLGNLMAVYNDMYEKQGALFDAFNAAIRSTVAKHHAERIKTINNQVDGNTVIWDNVNLRIYTLELFASSQVHRLVLVHEACNLIQYKNAGTMPEFCKRVIINPHGIDYDKLISYKYDNLMCDQDEISKYVTVPGKRLQMGTTNKTAMIRIPKGTLDLNAVYAGNETYFQIPNKQWLVQNKWISANENPTMIILKKFELFLPFIYNTSASKSAVTIENKLRFTGQNYITPGGPTYDFNVPQKFNYTFRYEQNHYLSCLKPLGGSLPYEIPDCTKPPNICVESAGTVEDSIYQPSIFSKWVLKASITGNLIPPETHGEFPLMAAVSFCYVNPTTVSTLGIRKAKKDKNEKSEQRRESKVNKKKRNACCASSGKYYDAHHTENHCQPCPPGTTVKLQGYYCG